MFKKLLQLKTLLVALFVMTGAGNAWADEVTYSLTPNQTNTGNNATSYITSLTEFTYNGISWKMNQWNPSTLQIKTNQGSAASEFRFYNTKGFAGRITKVEIKFYALTVSDASKLMFLGGTSEVTATTGGTAGTWDSKTKTLTWTPGTSDNFTFFAFYQNGKAASGNNFLAESEAIVVTYETGTSSKTATKTTIDDSNLTNRDVYLGTNAGYFSAIVKAGENPIVGASVTWSSTDTTVAEIDENTGEVTLVGEGTTTIKATYSGDEDYAASSADYSLVVTSSAPSPSWEETPLKDLTEDDVFVIVGYNGYNYAMTNDNGTSSAPSAISVNIEDDGKIAGTVADNLKWSIAGDATNGYSFYPYGSTESWLYCINNNNGVRVGTGDAKHFTLSKNGYLTTTETNERRYLGIYNHADWRCYTSEGGNIENQTFTFFRLVDSTLPRLTVSDVNVYLDYNATSGSIAYRLKNEVTGGVLKATSSDAWLTIGEPTTSSTIPLSCSENPTVESRTATVTLKYSYDTDKSITKTVTVTQKGYEPDYATLPFVWNGGTTEDLLALYGVTGNGLGENYAESNAPYRVKLDTNGDYIQVKTDSQPGKVTICVKMIGGGNSSGITVQQSENGEEFSDVESLSISGAQNTELTLETTKEFASSSRYVRLLFTKGSNVGVGAITIVGSLVSSAGYATFSSTSALDFTNVVDIHAYTATVSGNTISFKRVKKVPANTGLLLRSVNGGAVSTSVPSLTDAADDVADNAFVAATTEITSLATTEGDFTNYILNNGSSGIGFYKANGKKVGAGKAYLHVSSKQATTRAFIAFSFDDPETGIAQVETLPQQGMAYDLQGRRVNAPKGGLYIINGKKVIVK